MPGLPTPKIGASVNGGPQLTTPTITVTVGSTVVLTDISTGPPAVARTWAWSDLFVSPIDVSVTRTFSAVGTFVVTLSSINVSGTGEATMTIKVDPASANTGAATQAG